MKNFKTLSISSLAFAFLLFSTVACKKEEYKPAHVDADWLAGNWVADYEACNVYIDSSYSVFTHITDLSFQTIAEHEDGSSNTNFNWSGFISGNGGVEIYRAENLNQFDLLIVPYDPAIGIGTFKPTLEQGQGYQMWHLTGSNFDWSSFIPSGATPNDTILDFSKIYLKKVSETKMKVTVVFTNHYIVDYSYTKQ